MKSIIKGVKMSDVSIAPATIAQNRPIHWQDPLPIYTYPSRNIIDGSWGDRSCNVNDFMRYHVPITISQDTPLEFRKETVEYFPTQFELNELEEIVSSNVDTSKWWILIYETPSISEMWWKFLDHYFKSGRKFASVMVGIIQSPDVALGFTNLATDIIVGNDYTEPDRTFNYPIATLIMNIIEKRRNFTNMYFPRIIAFDEELESYDGIIKALALGADAVMIGKMAVKASECAGEVFKYDKDLNDLIRFTDKELPEGAIRGLGSSKLKTYKPYRYINPDAKSYEVTYNLEEMTRELRANLNNILSVTGSENIYKFRNNINVILT